MARGQIRVGKGRRRSEREAKAEMADEAVAEIEARQEIARRAKEKIKAADDFIKIADAILDDILKNRTAEEFLAANVQKGGE